MNGKVSKEFMKELERVQENNPNKSVIELVRFLFLGTKGKDPRIEVKKDQGVFFDQLK